MLMFPFVVQFGNQEPGSEEEIKKWATDNYKVTFDMFSKVNVKGDDIHPLFAFLLKQEIENNTEIRWNFDGKFMVNKEGAVIQRFGAKVDLTQIEDLIKEQK